MYLVLSKNGMNVNVTEVAVWILKLHLNSITLHISSRSSNSNICSLISVEKRETILLKLFRLTIQLPSAPFAEFGVLNQNWFPTKDTVLSIWCFYYFLRNKSAKLAFSCLVAKKVLRAPKVHFCLVALHNLERLFASLKLHGVNNKWHECQHFRSTDTSRLSCFFAPLQFLHLKRKLDSKGEKTWERLARKQLKQCFCR